MRRNLVEIAVPYVVRNCLKDFLVVVIQFTILILLLGEYEDFLLKDVTLTLGGTLKHYFFQKTCF